MVEPRKSQAEHARLFMEETQQRIKKSQGERLIAQRLSLRKSSPKRAEARPVKRARMFGRISLVLTVSLLSRRKNSQRKFAWER